MSSGYYVVKPINNRDGYFAGERLIYRTEGEKWFDWSDSDEPDVMMFITLSLADAALPVITGLMGV